MAEFYQEMQDVATGLLAEFKQGVVELVKVTKGAGPGYNPGTPTEVKHIINSTASGVDKKYINGTSIIQTDLQVIAPVSDIIPEMQDKIDLDGKRCEIVAIMPIPPIGVTVVNIIIVRK